MPSDHFAQTERLAWALVAAQGRMLDGWADADPDVRRTLWGNLHRAGDELREHLDTDGRPWHCTACGADLPTDRHHIPASCPLCGHDELTRRQAA